MKRFWDKVEIGADNDCWNWKAYRNKTWYGRFNFDGKIVDSHRVAWKLTFGEIEKGLFVLHKCDNPICCNPKHLFLGTTQDNTADKMSKGRHKSLQGNAHKMAKITDIFANEIRFLYATKLFLQKELADIYGVNQSMVSKIILNRNWSPICVP